VISEYKYEPADTSFIVNVEDVDLRPIRLSLPRVPSDLSLIDGYGLAPKDQRFHRIEIPPKLLRLESNCRKFVDERARQKGSQFVVTRLRLQKEFWETLIKEKDYYAQEIEWIKKFWWYRLHGYWFFNHGKPVYITGWHFVYLHTWYVPEIQPDGYPHYRDRDRKEFLIHKYCYTCTESFKNFDKDGWAISDDIGRYQMIDIGKRLCYGLLQPKNRRSGNTNKGLCIIHEIDSRTIGTDGAGIMSYTGNNAEKHFKQKMLVAWDKMPIWLVPFTITPGTPQRIIYNVPGNEFSISGLKNGISYADTGSSTYYDGQKLIAALLDESGKCFGKGTLIKMFDGSVKKIEDIRVGDKLMGDDGGIRNVLVLGSGRGPMYKIIPNSGDEWRCNGDHILSLRKSYKELPVNGEKDDIFEITVNDFLKLKKYVQKGLMLYRVGVNCPARQHMRLGFKVIYDSVDDFYGIVIDGNRRFLLSDYTVVHNTVTVDVDHRWQVVKNCLSQGMGSVIHGYSYHPSTVEEYSSGGDAYRRMANKSSFYQRIPGNHQTQSGLFRLFMPADEGLDGYIDSYGMSVRGEEPLPYQKEEGFKETATHFIKSTMEFLLKQDTPESLAEYRAIRKLFPLKWADCWVGESGEIGFPTEKINQRINELRKKSLTVTGNFEWSMGFHSNVVWKNDVNGRFEVSNLFTDIANRRIRDVVWDPINMEEKETWAPQFPDRGTIGADPYKFKSEAEIKKSYQKHGLSDGGIFVLWEYDRKIDGDKPRSEWESEDVICTYRYRPKTDDEFVEDVLKAAIWYGYMVYPESNINIIEKKFREWGYEGYLKYDIAPDGVMKVSPGMYLHTRNKQEGFNLMRNFLEFRVHKIKHLNFLIECNNINSIDQLTNYDLLAAGMCALSGSVSQYAKVLKRFNEKKIDVSLLVQRYRY